uniref:BHLH domain-containing protein n=1 Tax=Macrostomum lignano TaxID=282301 RepID=A0A1I8J3H4_9PLAT
LGQPTMTDSPSREAGSSSQRITVAYTNQPCRRKLQFINGKFAVQKPQTSTVQKRNERERNRVKLINRTFATLRDRLPKRYNGKKARKLSKVEVLKTASTYIAYLVKLLESDSAAEVGEFSFDQVQQRAQPSNMTAARPQQQQQQQQNDPQHQIHFSSAYTTDCFNMSTPIKPVTQCQQELPTTAAGPSYYLVAPEFVTTGGQFTCGGASQIHWETLQDTFSISSQCDCCKDLL